jgi:hypothetical protein
MGNMAAINTAANRRPIIRILHTMLRPILHRRCPITISRSVRATATSGLQATGRMRRQATTGSQENG